jgi:hypothetical protein
MRVAVAEARSRAGEVAEVVGNRGAGSEREQKQYWRKTAHRFSSLQGIAGPG